jgi:nitroreductase
MKRFFMNETIKNVIERRSIRKFKQMQVDDKELDLIIKAGSYAANAGGRQSPVMVILQNQATISKLGKINKRVFFQSNGKIAKMGNVSTAQPSIADDDQIESAFYGAPTVITVFSPKSHSYKIEDCSLVIGNMMIAAHSIGVGSCFIGRAAETFSTDQGQELIKEWGINEDYVAVGHCILGYPLCDSPPAKVRKEYVVKKIL